MTPTDDIDPIVWICQNKACGKKTLQVGFKLGKPYCPRCKQMLDGFHELPKNNEPDR